MIPHSLHLTTAEQSQQLDARTIDEFGIDGYTLMEIAGSKMAGHVMEEVPYGSHGVIICGKGNNGGDGLVVARYLVQNSYNVTVLFISGKDGLSPDAGKNLELLKKIDHEEAGESGLTFIDGWQPDQLSGEFNFLIDAMLGTGLDSDLRGDYPEAVTWLNEQELPTFAVDIPTGLNSDTGEIMGQSVRADKTFTFGTRKLGFYLGSGPKLTGDIIYCDLPFPNYLKRNHSRFLMDDTLLKTSSNEKSSIARHKYEAGVVYIVAGSEGLTGAAIMSAKSAWAEGVGAVILIAPRGIISTFEPMLPQIIKKPVGKREDHFFKQTHLQEVLKIINAKPGPVLLGPGLGRNTTTANFVCQLVNESTKDMVIDADALWALSQNSWQKTGNKDIIITPHPGELGRLVNKKITDDYNRLETVENYAVEKDITVVSKGYPTIVSVAGGASYLTSYDTRIFARAGFGDILAGKIAAFWAKDNSKSNSCIQALLTGYQKAIQLGKPYLDPLDLV